MNDRDRKEIERIRETWKRLGADWADLNLRERASIITGFALCCSLEAGFLFAWNNARVYILTLVPVTHSNFWTVFDLLFVLMVGAAGSPYLAFAWWKAISKFLGGHRAKV